MHSSYNLLAGIAPFLEIDSPIQVIVQELRSVGILIRGCNVDNSLTNIGKLPLLQIVGHTEVLKLFQRLVLINGDKHFIAWLGVRESVDNTSIDLHDLALAFGCISKQ